MRLGIKAKQVVSVTSIVVAVVVILSLYHLATLAHVWLEESSARAELVAKAVSQRATNVVADGADANEALRADSGLRSVLESAFLTKGVTFAAIADLNDVAVAHADPSLEGQPLPPGGDLVKELSRTGLSQLRTIYTGQGRNLEFRLPLFRGNAEFGSIRVGISTLLVRDELSKSLWPAIVTALAALGGAVFAATVLAQLLLRPIHMIRSGLTRLGRGEFGVRLDLDQDDEFGELGKFFNTVSAQLSADRSHMAGQVANLESAVEHLEDAVAMVSPRGELLFANPAMRALLPDAASGATLTDMVPRDHPLRQPIEQTLLSRRSLGPIAAMFQEKDGRESGERLIITHAVNDPDGHLVGVMVIARNLEYLGQVQSTIRYSRKLAALGRLSAGVAHEVKNPLNAMMIHSELLRQQFTGSLATVGGAVSRRVRGVATVTPEVPPVDRAAALQHVDVIAAEIRRLDEVVQGFLKFTRPEDLKLQPVRPASLFAEVVPILQPEATRAGVTVSIDCDGAPDINGDPAMLRQAFLNLGINACQAMPNGGTLQIRCEAARDRRVAVSFRDTGVGIESEDLQKIFNLYFTTKQKGTGIGLSMVYRTIQMHDGEIEVQSTPGSGTTFRILLLQA